jgi:uncharacterized membrane protein
MNAEITALRVIHIVGGVFWVGTTLFLSYFLMPAMAQAGPGASGIMAGLHGRRLFTLLPIAAILTMLSGARLMWIFSSGFSAAYFASTGGLIYGLAALAAVVAFLVGMMVSRPAAMQMTVAAQRLASGSLDEAEKARLTESLPRLRARSARASSVVAVLLVAATVGMAIARYL